MTGPAPDPVPGLLQHQVWRLAYEMRTACVWIEAGADPMVAVAGMRRVLEQYGLDKPGSGAPPAPGEPARRGSHARPGSPWSAAGLDEP